mgnify:FL=1
MDRRPVQPMLGGSLIDLSHDDIHDVEAFLRSTVLSDDPVTNEYRKEQLFALCRMATRVVNNEECQHRWEKDGIVPRCAKCGAMP